MFPVFSVTYVPGCSDAASGGYCMMRKELLPRLQDTGD